MGSFRFVLRLRTRLPWRLASILALTALAALAFSGALGQMQDGVLILLSVLMLVVVLITHPYPGERAIARLRARRAPHPVAPMRAAGSPRPSARLARGGRLIAVALAGRAPPLHLAACR